MQIIAKVSSKINWWRKIKTLLKLGICNLKTTIIYSKHLQYSFILQPILHIFAIFLMIQSFLSRCSTFKSGEQIGHCIISPYLTKPLSKYSVVTFAAWDGHYRAWISIFFWMTNLSSCTRVWGASYWSQYKVWWSFLLHLRLWMVLPAHYQW